MWEGFAQDSWKTRQNLTITFGARYSVNVPYHAIWNNMIVSDPTCYDPRKAVSVDPTTGLMTGTPQTARLYNGRVIPGSGFPSSAKGRVPEADSGLYNGLFRGVPNRYSNIQLGDIQPRLGIAYQFNTKTVFRAGAGRYFTRLGVSDSVFLGGNPPFQPNASVTNNSIDNLGPSISTSIPLVVTTQSKAFKNPEAWAWNFTVEREMFWHTLLSVGYVARRGVHLHREADINHPTTAVPAAHPRLVAQPPCSVDAFRPYQGFASIQQPANAARAMHI